MDFGRVEVGPSGALEEAGGPPAAPERYPGGPGRGRGRRTPVYPSRRRCGPARSTAASSASASLCRETRELHLAVAHAKVGQRAAQPVGGAPAQAEDPDYLPVLDRAWALTDADQSGDITKEEAAATLEQINEMAGDYMADKLEPMDEL